MNTPTPETNALIATDQHQLEDDSYMPASTYWRMCDLTRKLERERDEAREVLREIRDNEVNPEDEADKFLRDHVPSELSKVREQRDAVTLRLGETQERMIDAERQRDKLAEALIRIALMDSDNAEPWAIHQHISAIAHNAIHSLKS